jgi:ATP-dependent Clp protease ATP-binding subunit ClpX
MSKPKTKSGDVLRCSFCNKKQSDVRKLIAGPTVYICDECVDICLDIIAEDKTKAPRELETTPLPMGMIAAADEITPGHDDAKRLLAATLAQHAARVSEDTVQSAIAPVFIAGAMGSGKSQIVRAMASAAGFAFASIEIPLLFSDAPFKPTIELEGFENAPGVIVLNRIETAAMRTSDADEHRRVQQSLISIIDGQWLQLGTEKSGTTHRSRPTFDTGRALFVALATLPELPAGGTFDYEFLAEQGFLPELLARFGSFVRLQPLSSADMITLLTRERGLIAHFARRLEKYNLRPRLDPDAVDEIVRLGIARKAGVRGLKALMDRLGIAVACEQNEPGVEFGVDAAYIRRHLQ